MKYSAMVQGQPVTIDVKRIEAGEIEAEIGGRSYTLHAKRVERGIYWFNWNNQSLEIGISESPEGYVVSLGGERLDVEIIDARAALRRAAHQGHAGAASVRAPMPGKVVKLLVSEGAEVQPNEGLVVLEAMKMQNEIKSPKKGIVRTLDVVEGAAVNAGDLLATVE